MEFLDKRIKEHGFLVGGEGVGNSVAHNVISGHLYHICTESGGYTIDTHIT
jgi:hypothetical protein